MSSPLSKTFTGLSLVAAVLFFVLWQRAQRPQPSPPAEPASAEAARTEPPVAAAPAPESRPEINALKARLLEESRARQRAEAETAALRQQTNRVPTNMVLGRIQAHGKQAGTFLPVMGELSALTRRDPGTLSADEKRRLLELQREQAKLLGALPEITAYQNNPDDYARFFSSMMQQTAGLNDAQTAQVHDYMRQRGLALNEAGLNAAKEPTDPKQEEEWEERRDAFNAQTAQGLRGILPPGAAETVGISPELLEFLEMDFDKVNLPKAAP